MERLLDIKVALEKRLAILKSGSKIAEFSYLSPSEFNKKFGIEEKKPIIKEKAKVPGEEQIEDSDVSEPDSVDEEPVGGKLIKKRKFHETEQSSTADSTQKTQKTQKQ